MEKNPMLCFKKMFTLERPVGFRNYDVFKKSEAAALEVATSVYFRILYFDFLHELAFPYRIGKRM